MTAYAPKEMAETSQSHPHRCLILANGKAGSIRSLRDKITAAGLNLWRRATFQTEPIDCDEEPECIPALALAAAASGLEAHIESIPPPHQIPERIRAAEQQGFDTIVAAGGDGTVHSVAQGMVNSRLQMGIIPMGTANNIARVLGLPLKVEEAMDIIARSKVQKIDVGRVAGRYFLEAAGVGLFADAFAAFGKDEPRKWQILRNLRVLGPMMWNPPVRNLQLTLDGVAEKDAAVWIAVSNSSYIGDNMQLAPDASMEDGEFDVIIVGAMNRHELLQFIIALYRGKHLELPKVRRVRAKSIAIQRVHRSHRPLPVHADAEIVGFTPTLLETVPAAIRVLVP
jgi:YegS/Rv2252/BmrU family lipid kinase